jgi:GDP-L-fucose synthase
MNWNNKQVLVTGGNGFLGSALVKMLNQKNPSRIITPSSKTHDLRIKENCDNITKDIDIVFHLAAHVGGIGLNKEKPGDLFYDNLLMGTFLMDSAQKNGVEKFISLGTMCSYPKQTLQPITEEFLWDGYPEEVTSSYGMAKKMQIVQSMAYKQQFDFNSITVFVTNLYGPFDNFEGESSHVIPAIIEKIWNSKKNGQNYVELWGDGTPTRDFLYVDDAAAGLILAAEKYDKTEPLNLGSSLEISIEKLARLIMKLMDIDLEIKWNTMMPNGQIRRCVSYEKARKEIGFEPKTTLEEGLRKTIHWFQETQTKPLKN